MEDPDRVGGRERIEDRRRDRERVRERQRSAREARVERFALDVTPREDEALALPVDARRLGGPPGPARSESRSMSRSISSTVVAASIASGTTRTTTSPPPSPSSPRNVSIPDATPRGRRNP